MYKITFKKKFLLIGILIFGIVVLSSSLFDDKKVFASTQPIKATFVAPIPILDIANLVKYHGVSVVNFHYTQGDIQGGYTVQPGENIDEAVKNFNTAHTKFFTVAIKNTEKDINGAKNQEAKQRLSALYNQLIFAQSTNKDGLKIDLIETDDEQSLEGLKKAGYIKNIDSGQSFNKKITARLHAIFSKKVKFINTAQASLWHESWAPYAGGSDVQQTYTYQTFYFNNISNYGSADTYEHETQVYDKNFANYAGYWSSNMPSAYYDTPFLDSIDNFTVGTFNAASLQTYTQYYTYMSLSAGSASSATVRIKGQKGHRYPSWCYSTWCVYADATTGSMASFNAPSGMSWEY